ncbi:hypothetical protein SAMN05421740_1241, partial [Parapedobacter koreensis]
TARERIGLYIRTFNEKNSRIIENLDLR